jgi:hypothetical protein
VRDWARYQGRITQRPTPSAPQQTLDSVALGESRETLSEVQYWSSQPIYRLAFIAEVLRKLDREGWPNKPDIGWSDFDVEIYGRRWSRLQLTTVTEDYASKKHLIRCRLRTHWSLQAQVVFWGLVAFELIVLGFLTPRWHWLWFALLSLPLVAWLLQRDQRTLRSMTVVFLGQLAADLKLIKIRVSDNQSAPTGTAQLKSNIADPGTGVLMAAQPNGKQGL